MIDPIERADVLAELAEFRHGIFHDKNLTSDNKHDWDAAYCMEKLHDALYRLPQAEPQLANQIVKRYPWCGEVHHCSKCKKIVPFIDWCQPYCSGCGARFRNYHKWCRKDNEVSADE